MFSCNEYLSIGIQGFEINTMLIRNQQKGNGDTYYKYQD